MAPGNSGRTWDGVSGWGAAQTPAGAPFRPVRAELLGQASGAGAPRAFLAAVTHLDLDQNEQPLCEGAPAGPPQGCDRVRGRSGCRGKVG